MIVIQAVSLCWTQGCVKHSCLHDSKLSLRIGSVTVEAAKAYIQLLRLFLNVLIREGKLAPE